MPTLRPPTLGPGITRFQQDQEEQTNEQQNAMKRFWDRVEKRKGCWLWSAGKFTEGYGSFYLNGKHHRAHRIAWTLAKGPIPDGLCVLHRRDNPPCVKPAHLFLGTNADNHADMVAKGRERYSMGEKNGGTNLTEIDVIEIRNASGLHREIAARFGLARGTVSQIKRRERWGHVE